MWNRTIRVCESETEDDLSAEDLAEFIISEACKLACNDEVRDNEYDIGKGVEGYFDALNPSDAARAIAIASVLRDKIRRRKHGECPFQVVNETIAVLRPTCLQARRREASSGFSLHDFYEDFPSFRPKWWKQNSDATKTTGEKARTHSFAEWMDGKKRAERETASREEPPTRKKGRLRKCVINDDAIPADAATRPKVNDQFKPGDIRRYFCRV
eukprot:jgi/Mesvir1/11581/Mv04343-RA.1